MAHSSERTIPPTPTLPSIDETIRADQIAKIAGVLRDHPISDLDADLAARILDTLLNVDPTGLPIPGWRLEIVVEGWASDQTDGGTTDYHPIEMGSPSEYANLTDLERAAWRKIRAAISQETEEKERGD